VRITRGADTTKAAFTLEHQGLNNQSMKCPGGK
jgi:hypothetical protein